MKLLSCHIDNFGTLSKEDYSFKDGIDCICKNNGTGKTTFAAFIEAMLYGMDTAKANDKNQKDRSKYAPWNCQKFGGTLTLEAANRKYRIERTFDVTSAVKDRLTCYDITDYAKETELLPTPGESLLGIPKEAFLRTVFLSGKDTGNIDGILPKLNQCVNGEADDRIYKEALTILTDAKKQYKAERGKGGSIEDLTQQLKQADSELRLCAASKESAENLENQKNEYESRIKKNQDTLDLVSACQSALLIKNQYNDLEKKAKDAQTALESFDKEHPSLPNEELLSQGRGLLGKIGLYTKDLDSDPLEEGEKSDYKRLCLKFEKRKTSDEEISRIELKHKTLALDKKTLENNKSLLGSEEYSALKDKFGKNCPTEEELESLDKLSSDYQMKKSSYDEQVQRILDQSKEKKKNRGFTPLSIAFLAVGAALALLGIVFLITGLPAALVFLIVGIIGLCAGGYLVFSPAHTDGPDENAEKAESEYKEAYTKLSDKLNLYGYFGNDLSLLLSHLKEDRIRYLEKKDSYDTAKEEIEPLKKRIEQDEKEVDEFFEAFGIDRNADCEMQLKYLKTDLSCYESIGKKILDAKEENEKKEKLLSEAEEEFDRLFGAYAQEDDNDREDTLKNIENDIKNRIILANDAKTRYYDVVEYKKNNVVPDELPALPDEDEIEKIQTELKTLSALKATCEKNLEQAERNSERENEWKEIISALNDEISKQQNEHRILSLTAELLRRAEERLTSKYSEPMKNAYSLYANEIDGALCEGISLDPGNMSLCFDRMGAYRKADSFSSGFNALSDICMRLAMIDVAYPNERPFLILDDPFAYLDDENASKAIKALDKLSQNTQILYFTCHTSRMIRN